ncbi:hypothetical protein D3C72_1715480 [compost metagenome]
MATKAVGHQIDAFGGAFNEYDLFRRAGIDKRRHLFTHRFHFLRRLGAHGVDAAMHRRITVTIKIQLAIDYRLRLLRTGRAVEVSQRLAVDLTRQDREIAAHPFDGKTHAASPGSGKRRAMRASTDSRMVSLPIPSVSSAAKAKIIICCAACLSMPRDCR